MKSKINVILKKLSILLWFFLRPKYYQHLFFLIKRKFLLNHDTSINQNKAYCF